MEASAVDGLHHGQYAFKLWSDEVEGAKETDLGEGAEAWPISHIWGWSIPGGHHGGPAVECEG